MASIIRAHLVLNMYFQYCTKFEYKMFNIKSLGKLSVLPTSYHQFQSPINEDIQKISASG